MIGLAYYFQITSNDAELYYIWLRAATEQHWQKLGELRKNTKAWQPES
jgi:hypothetical protein